jgi:hypothetical protein
LEYSLEPLDFWQNVVFTNEKIFQSCYNGRVRVYRPPNSHFDESYTQKVVVNGRFSVNVWGWISAQGPEVLTHIIGRNNAKVYLHTLENIMLSSVNAVFPQNHFIYQHNYPIHTAKIISYWMEQVRIRVLPWPSRSPDLNPIENILGLMIRKRRRVIGKKFKKCETN